MIVMAENEKLHITITSPYGEVLEKEADSILFTTPDGQISIRAKHISGIYNVLEEKFLVKNGEDVTVYYSNGGMLMVDKNKVSFVSPLATLEDEFELEKQKHLELLSKRYSEDVKSEADLQRVQMALRNSLVQKK